MNETGWTGQSRSGHWLVRDYPADTVLHWHVHREAQLIYPLSGVLRVRTALGRWLVPARTGMWLPFGEPHEVDMGTRVTMLSVYYPAAVCRRWTPGDWSGRIVAFGVPALAQALLNTLLAAPGSNARMAMILRLLLLEVSSAPAAPTFLPMPSSPSAQRAAALALSDPQGRISLEGLARRSGSSARTLSRQFSREAGMSYQAWRQRARIVASMDALLDGVPIKQVAANLGFSSATAFSQAFRQVLGMTPGQFRAASR